MNVHHYDMSEDVVKIAGVEFYSLTGNHNLSFHIDSTIQPH
jgi:hypothetical protein